MSEGTRPSYLRVYQNMVQCSRTEAMEFLRYLAVTFALWLVGYMHFSLAWIVLILMIFLIWQFELEKKKKHREHLLQCHQSSYVNKMEGLPSWVYFTENEQVEWLNRMLVQMWPYIGGMVHKILKENVEPELQKSLPKALSSLYFETIDLGNTPPQFKHVVAYDQPKDERQNDYIFDLDLSYRGDANLKLSVKGVNLGISNIELKGPLRVIFKPLVSEYNPVGGLTVFFLNRPQLKFDLNNLLNVLDFPGLKSTLRRIINDVIASFVVLPNRVVVPLAEGVDGSDLQYPIPEGVLRISVLEAKELTACDFGLVNKGKSDPYTIVEVGAQQFRTKIISNNLNPEWNETFEAFVDNHEGQEIGLQVYDEDTSSKDTKIGFIQTDIDSVVQQGARNVWLPLQGVKQGRVHLQLNWYELSPIASDLLPPTSPGTSVAALMVKPISAAALPVTKKPSLQSVFCEVTVGDLTKNTFTAYGEKTEWKQALRFFVNDPEGQEAKIKVIEAKGNKILGKLAIDVRSLLNKPDMTIQQTFPLEASGEKSVLTCRFVLRVFKAPDPKHIPDENKSAQLR